MPRVLAGGDPLLDGAESFGYESAGTHPTHLLGANNTTALQDLEVLDHRCLRYRQRAGEVSDARRAAAELLDDPPPGPISEGVP